MADHSEAVQIEYDPSQISYKELLDIFWKSHDPSSQPWSVQYRNILFYHNEEQKRAAEESIAELRAENRGKLLTDIRSYKGFSLAEGYHQKHTLRIYNDIVEEFGAMYPEGEWQVSSTAAARVNGYLSGIGTCDEVTAEIDTLGLSPAGQKKLLSVVCSRWRTESIKPECKAGCNEVN